MSLPPPPRRRSLPCPPRISSLSGVPAPFAWPRPSWTIQKVPLTAGQPLWLTFPPPPEVRRLFPGQQWTPDWKGGHRPRERVLERGGVRVTGSTAGSVTTRYELAYCESPSGPVTRNPTALGPAVA